MERPLSTTGTKNLNNDSTGTLVVTYLSHNLVAAFVMDHERMSNAVSRTHFKRLKQFIYLLWFSWAGCPSRVGEIGYDYHVAPFFLSELLKDCRILSTNMGKLQAEVWRGAQRVFRRHLAHG